MRFVHSYWSKPMKEKRWGYEPEELQRGDLLTFALSVLYIKKLGHTIVLHTDDDGKKLLGGLPYDEIYTTLNDIPEDIPSMMWAYGKFFAMKNEPLGAIHIDGDVFIKKQECLDIINDNNCDIFCQNLDRRAPSSSDPQIHYAAWKLLNEFNLDWKGYPTNGEYQYNVGILRFLNQELKYKYFNFFYDITEQVQNHPIAIKAIKQSAFCAISVVAEQQFLYEMIQKDGYKVKTLINKVCDEGYIDTEALKEFEDLGYEHILGARKYHMKDELMNQLYDLDKNLFHKISAHPLFVKEQNNEDIRFVHTYWSRPAQNARWDVDKQKQEVSNILIQTLSVAYLKRLGQKIVLHTDDHGKEMFKHLPYDEVFTTLNEIPSDVPNFIWAYGKFFAMKNEPLGAIHIDGDVFIKKQECLDKITSGDYDILLQNIECEPDTRQGVRIYSWSWDRLKNIKFTDEFDWLHGYFGYNVGVIRIKNQELKDKYFNFYFNNVDYIKSQMNAIEQLNTDTMACPDVILEQQALYELINRDGYNVKLLLSNTKDFSVTQLDARLMGFQHLIGKKKYSLVTRVKKVLSIIDPELYEKTMAHLSNMYGEWVLDYEGIPYVEDFSL